MNKIFYLIASVFLLVCIGCASVPVSEIQNYSFIQWNSNFSVTAVDGVKPKIENGYIKVTPGAHTIDIQQSNGLIATLAVKRVQVTQDFKVGKRYTISKVNMSVGHPKYKLTEHDM